MPNQNQNPNSNDPVKQLTRFTPWFWKDFSQQIVSLQLFILSSLNKLNSEPESLRENHLKLRIFETSAETYASTHGCNVTKELLPLEQYTAMLKKSFEMSLFLQNVFFLIYDSSEVSQRPDQTDNMRRHKEKSRILLEDFSRLASSNLPAPGSGSVRFKSSRFSSQLMKPIQEENTPGSADFINFINNYYVDQ